MRMEASEYAVDEANEKRLKCWLTAGQWTRNEATLLFLEIDPDREYGEVFSTFSGLGEVQYDYFDDECKTRVPCGVDEEGEPEYLSAEQDALLYKTRGLFSQIARSLNLHDLAEPHEWIELAGKKGIVIPWLDWAIERGLYVQKQEFGAVSNAPVVGESASAPIQRHLLATPDKLIAAFYSFTGMNEEWFNSLGDKPEYIHEHGRLAGKRNIEPGSWHCTPQRTRGDCRDDLSVDC